MQYPAFAFAMLVAVGSAVSLQPVQAETMSLSQDWRFHKGEMTGAENPALDDAPWRQVVVPHDFSIENGPDGKAPFDAATVGAADSGYIAGGIGWYRRHLAVSADTLKKVVLLDFEAVYMDADIWLNGTHLAKHHYGYTAFQLDLTGKLHAGDNVIAVRVNHEDSSSRWYAGSGIIRPVSLEVLPLVHIASDGPAIVTPVATPARGEVQVATPVVNTTSRPVVVTLTTQILDANGKAVTSATSRLTLHMGEQATAKQTLSVSNPKLWDTETPNLYRLSQRLAAGSSQDGRDTTFGIRTIAFDAEHGLLLNGKRILLRGGNIHHDSYMLGAASFPRAEARKLEWMKAAGYNAVRSAHNPLSQASLDAADRLGLLMIDEAFDVWAEPKRPKDYARFFETDWQDDLRSLIISGRNHPSVVMWSIGNEIPEQTRPIGGQRAAMLAARVRSLDPSRPVTEAVSKHESESVYAQLDIAGYNYMARFYGPDHAAFPKRLMMATESYPDAAFDSWEPTKTMPWVVGDFVWTAVDYLGEASIGGTGYTQDWKQIGPYPWHLAWCGEIDAIGRMRPNAYYRQIVWGHSPYPVAAFVRWPGPNNALPDYASKAHAGWVMQDLHPSWSWPGYEGKSLEVVVYSELPEVELFLNGRSLGRKTVSERYQATFAVPYEAGTLKAVGYRAGKAAGAWTLETTGAPAAIQISADRSKIAADGMDLSYVTAKLVDAKDRDIYSTVGDKKVTFTVEGAGTLAGVGNGNPVGTESFQSDVRTTFHGAAVAVIRAGTTPGDVVVKVSADGLPSQRLVLHVTP